MKSLAALCWVGLVFATDFSLCPLNAAEKPEATAALQAQIARLEKENEALRAENTVLRRLIVAPAAEAVARPAPVPLAAPPARTATAAPYIPIERVAETPPPAPVVAPPTTNTPPPEVITEIAADAPVYWMSHDGKRHNSKCRQFRLGSGRYCSPKAGEACSACGG